VLRVIVLSSRQVFRVVKLCYMAHCVEIYLGFDISAVPKKRFVLKIKDGFQFKRCPLKTWL